MKKISIIYGGRSTEHDASLKSIENFLENLNRKEFEIVDLIFIDREGNIFINDVKRSIGELIDKIKTEKETYFLNLLHGQEGEDGSWSGLFDICDATGTFESVNTSSILMNKFQQSACISFAFDEIKVPKTVILNRNNDYNLKEKINIFNNSEIIVKPNNMGASHFVKRFNNKDIKSIDSQIKKIFEYDDEVLIQEFIEGDEYTCGVINYNDKIKVLPIIHAKPKSDFLNHEVKHTTGNIICDFNDFKEKKQIESISISLFKLFKVVGMCRFDYLITKTGNIYYLEGNLIPGFSKGSAFPMMLKEANISLTEFTIELLKAFEKHTSNNKYLPYNID